VKLATGDFSIEEAAGTAGNRRKCRICDNVRRVQRLVGRQQTSVVFHADYLVRNVPMDRETAMWEAVFFASVPGQALSYTVREAWQKCRSLPVRQ
jgi:hypothetical protein